MVKMDPHREIPAMILAGTQGVQFWVTQIIATSLTSQWPQVKEEAENRPGVRGVEFIPRKLQKQSCLQV